MPFFTFRALLQRIAVYDETKKITYTADTVYYLGRIAMQSITYDAAYCYRCYVRTETPIEMDSGGYGLGWAQVLAGARILPEPKNVPGGRDVLGK